MGEAAALELDRVEEEYQVASQEFQAEFNSTTAAGDMSMKAASHRCTHHCCTHHHAATAHRD
jgi:hypothetical protein